MPEQNRSEYIDGRGPFDFAAPELGPGESFLLDFENRRDRGRNRYYERFLPFDAATVTNLNDTAALSVEFNGLFQSRLPPNVTTSFSDVRYRKIKVTNKSTSATITSGEVRVTAELTPYDGDDAARADRKKSPARDVIEGLTGVDPATLLGGR